jgi:ribose transport system substrate-binding protein
MFRGQRRFPLVALALAAATAAGCGSGKSTSSSAAAGGGTTGSSKACSDPRIIQAKDWNSGAKKLPSVPAAEVKGKRIAFIGFGQDNPWSGWVFKAVKCEAEANGASATFIGPPKFDAQVQFQEVTDLATSKNYDALVIAPNDSTSIAPALKQLSAAGVPVVSVEQPAGPDVLSMKNQVPGMTGNVIEDLTVNAQAMADGVIDACKNTDPCEVGVLWGARTLAFDKVKPKIFDARIASSPNIKIVCQSDAGYAQDLGRTQAADCLQAHPKLNVLASQADQQTRGAEASIKSAGRTMGLGKDDLKIVSAYATTYGVKQVRDGKWLQTSYNRPQSLGAAGTRLVLLALASVKLSPEQSFIVQDRDFDSVPSRLTKQVLTANPNVLGQWEG